MYYYDLEIINKPGFESKYQSIAFLCPVTVGEHIESPGNIMDKYVVTRVQHRIGMNTVLYATKENI